MGSKPLSQQRYERIVAQIEHLGTVLHPKGRPRKDQWERVLKAKKQLAKIYVTIICNEINNVVIRPGPKPEERECTEVAKELKEFRPVLIEKLAQYIF